VVWSTHTLKYLNVRELQQPTGLDLHVTVQGFKGWFSFISAQLYRAPLFLTSAIINDSKGSDPSTPRHKHL